MRKLYVLILIVLLISCRDGRIGTDSLPPVPDRIAGPFQSDGSNILKNGLPINYRGVNTLQTFGLGNQELMDEWDIEIVREFIGNLREQPITGDAIQASDGVWYHSMQKIADANRAHNRVTIFCPFGWVNSQGEQTLFSGLNPSSQAFYNEYKGKMQQIAMQFRDQPDVWIEVWNEPYHWNNEKDYTHELWLRDMKDMVDNLRWVNDFQNMIIVPGNEQGQSEESIIEYGENLLNGRYNLVFDLHAYEKWLQGSTEAELRNRIEKIDFAFIFGEAGVHNVSDVMEVQHFLNASASTGTTVLAWLWNQNSDDYNALLTDDGQPHATPENNFWGQKYRDFLTH